MITVLNAGGQGGDMGSLISMMVIWVVVIGGMMYFMNIKPQKKEQKRMAELFAALEVGDSVLTTSGFYGVVIDIPSEKHVVVEFGSNKNCRIPMLKTAIVKLEKPGQPVEEVEKK